MGAGTTFERHEAFAEALAEVDIALYRSLRDGSAAAGAWRNDAIDLWVALRTGTPPDPQTAQWWHETSSGLLDRFLDADRLALELACGEAGFRYRPGGTRGSGRALGSGDAWFLVRLWLARRQTPGSADRIAARIGVTLDAWFVRANGRDPDWQASVDLVPVLAVLDRGDPAPFRRSVALLRVVTDHVPAWLAADRASRQRSYLASVLAGLLAAPAWEKGLLEPEQRLSLLFASPELAAARMPGERSDAARFPRLRSEVPAVLAPLIAQAAAGHLLADWERAVLFHFDGWRGVEHFLAVMHALDRGAWEGGSLGPWPPDDAWSGSHPLAWATRALRRMPPPDAADRARLGELVPVGQAPRVLAAYCNPAWATVMEEAGVGAGPGVAGIARWLDRHVASPWSVSEPPGGRPAWSGDTVPGDRAALATALAEMGEAAVGKVLRDKAVRRTCPLGVFFLAAVLGRNAADIEARFLRRDKRAVAALGMLPDEGDVLDRYLALRRFAEETGQFGAQRQASERKAVEVALAHLAHTAGYADAERLAWAMEGEVARDLDDGGRIWRVGDYVLSLAADEVATLRVERAGKALKAVPPAARKAPEFVEVRAARATFLAHVGRVRIRLEGMLAGGKVLDRAAFAPALETAGGRLLLPRLVLRVWADGPEGAPTDVLGFRTLTGEELDPVGCARFAVAHPLDLAAVGTLGAWQRRLVETGLTQPFNQLFRGLYRATAEERETRESHRFAGRRVVIGPLRTRLGRVGWQGAHEVGFYRRLPDGTEAVLWPGTAAWDGASAVAAVETLSFGDPADWRCRVALHPLHTAEVFRQVDFATAGAAADKAAAVPSREVVAARAALVRALVPEAEIAEDVARAGGGAVHLGTGAAFGPDGAVLHPPELPVPPAFPYPDPDATTAAVVARLLSFADAGRTQP